MKHRLHFLCMDFVTACVILTLARINSTIRAPGGQILRANAALSAVSERRASLGREVRVGLDLRGSLR